MNPLGHGVEARNDGSNFLLRRLKIDKVVFPSGYLLRTLDQLVQRGGEKHLKYDPQGDHQHRYDSGKGNQAEPHELALFLREYLGIQGNFKITHHRIAMHDDRPLGGCTVMVFTNFFKNHRSPGIRYRQYFHLVIFKK